MADDVTITRDRWGIGHAIAPDVELAFQAQGWMAASDRLWQMEWDRRRALGRWAEVAGPSGVGEDRFFRRLDLASVAKTDWAALGEETRAMAEAYARGVNAWIAANGHALPPEFEHHPAGPEPWEPWHSVLVYKVRHLFMGSLHRKLWRGVVALRAGADVATAMVGDPGSDTAMVPASGPPIDLLTDADSIMAAAAADLAAIPDVDGASNSWAVHGSRTASGAPLLAGDPHRGIEFPNVYHQCHLACDRFDVIGLAFPGVPGFPHFGHNDRVAWCITHGMADDTDVFVERGPVAVTATETIDVFGADPVEVTRAATDRGPIVLGDPEASAPSLAMMWTGIFGADSTFDCLLPMLVSRTVDELEVAVERWTIPVNNLLTADVDGDISFRLRGRVVERAPASRWTAVPGDDANAWTETDVVADERLHRWRNPERGYLVTANNRTGDDGPFISLDFAGPARHDRIVQLLGPLTAATIDDMAAIHADTVSLVAPRILSILATAAPATDGGRAALDALAGWDGDVAGDSVAATVYTAFRIAWSTEVAHRAGIDGHELAEPGWPSSVSVSRMLFEAASELLIAGRWDLIAGRGPGGTVRSDGTAGPDRTAGSDGDEDLESVLGGLLDRVAADLAERLGADMADWRWDRVHTMASPHPLASARPELAHLHPPIDGCPGDGDTVRCASVGPRTGYRIASSSVARYVFDLSDWDRSGWVVPHGVSGVGGSGHDLDQRSSWSACELLPMAYSTAAIAEVAAGTETPAL